MQHLFVCVYVHLLYIFASVFRLILAQLQNTQLLHSSTKLIQPESRIGDSFIYINFTVLPQSVSKH